MCERDDMIIAGLARKRRGRIGWCRRSVYGYGIGEVAGCEEGAFEAVVVGSACNFDTLTTSVRLELRIRVKRGIPRPDRLVQVGLCIADIFRGTAANLEIRRCDLARNTMALVVRHVWTSTRLLSISSSFRGVARIAAAFSA